MAEHGYVRYSTGCRCQVCRDAKAVYTREKRSVARDARLVAEDAGLVYVAPVATHGIGAYQNASCRCEVCRRAAKAKSVARRRRGVA